MPGERFPYLDLQIEDQKRCGLQTSARKKKEQNIERQTVTWKYIVWMMGFNLAALWRQEWAYFQILKICPCKYSSPYIKLCTCNVICIVPLLSLYNGSKWWQPPFDLFNPSPSLCTLREKKSKKEKSGIRYNTYLKRCVHIDNIICFLHENKPTYKMYM